MNYIILKSFFTAEETTNKMKRQSTELENILQTMYLITYLYPKYIKNLYDFTYVWTLKTNQKQTHKYKRKNWYLSEEKVEGDGQSNAGY